MNERKKSEILNEILERECNEEKIKESEKMMQKE
jgi:hypothetical protein